MNKYPTLEQKKAAMRVIYDLVNHDNDMSHTDFVYLSNSILQALMLNLDDFRDALKEYYKFKSISLIADLNQALLLAFRLLMLEVLTHDGRIPSELEKSDFEKYHSALPNPDGLPLTYDAMRKRFNRELRLYRIGNLDFSWIHDE